MPDQSKFRVEAGTLAYEVAGPKSFVTSQIERHREQIAAILAEQLKLASAAAAATSPAGATRKRKGPGRPASTRSAVQRRPGRTPVIIRDSDLSLRASQITELRRRLQHFAHGRRLGKDATVFGIAYYLCTDVLKRDSFTAGDVMRAHEQLGKVDFAPAAAEVDVVQMLRNLAAASIGKEWVKRNEDGSFSLTAKGRRAGESGEIVRPRGRRPRQAEAATPARRGRPAAKPAAKKTARAAAGTPARRGPGRPRKNAA